MYERFVQMLRSAGTGPEARERGLCSFQTRSMRTWLRPVGDAFRFLRRPLGDLRVRELWAQAWTDAFKGPVALLIIASVVVLITVFAAVHQPTFSRLVLAVIVLGVSLFRMPLLLGRYADLSEHRFAERCTKLWCQVKAGLSPQPVGPQPSP
jgi:hypothetical protein